MSRRAMDAFARACRISAPEHEQGAGRERERDKIHRHHIVQDLLIAPRKGETVAKTPWSTMATTGAPVRGESQPTSSKNNPSRAIAEYTRGAVRMPWLKKPSGATAVH